jgi:hypothetical protein
MNQSIDVHLPPYAGEQKLDLRWPDLTWLNFLMGAHHHGMDGLGLSLVLTVLQDAISYYDTAYQLTINRQGLHFSIEDHPSVDYLFHWQLSTVAS